MLTSKTNPILAAFREHNEYAIANRGDRRVWYVTPEEWIAYSGPHNYLGPAEHIEHARRVLSRMSTRESVETND